MRELARIPLPPHAADGEFDHAAVDPVNDRLYVAHPSVDAVEIVDLHARRHLGSLPGLRGVAGVWVDAPSRHLFTSNRGEDTVSIFRLEEGGSRELFRSPTGVRPNGMAFDTARSTLLVAGVGDATRADAPPTLSFIDARSGRPLGRLTAPGRTRWAIFHPPTDAFYVNIAAPASVIAIRAGELDRISRTYPIPAMGPHGLEQDPRGDLLYCACDAGVLVALDLDRGSPRVVARLSGPPDVLWLNRARSRLYAAIGEPGLVDVFDLDPFRPSEKVVTAADAHTLTVDERRDEVHVFLPGSHEDLVLEDRPR